MASLLSRQRRVNCVDREYFKLDDFTHADSLNRCTPIPRQRNRPSTAFFLWKDSWYRMQSDFVVSDAVPRGIGCRSSEFPYNFNAIQPLNS